MLMNDEQLDGASRVALVTGSTTGLGFEIACALGHAGHRVALNYHNDQARADKALRRFRAKGLTGRLYRSDVTDGAAVATMFEAIEADLGPVDVLVVNATPSQPQRNIEDYSWEDYEAMLHAFIKSPFLLSQRVVAHMKAQTWGRIIQIGSEVLALGSPQFTAYVAAKGGQNGFTRSLASELAPWGITVNMVSPGWIPVERHRDVDPQIKNSYLKTVPMGRWGQPDDVASAVAYFASDASSFVTGANLHVNGGRTVQ